MSLKLTAASFLNGVRNSGLVDPESLEAVTREMRAAGSDHQDSRAIAAELVKRELITSWQADKLLQGRHKGFFLGRYRLMRLLGTGQMSAVYLGRHIYMDHLVAIKVLPADKVGDTSYLGRFYREAKAVAALSHPNIIRAFDVDKQVEAGTDIHFLVMEYVEGTSLTQLMAQSPNQKLDLVFVADVIRQAAEGLAHAHQKNLVHRDIKPDNLLITPQGEVKILDLGLARFFKTTDEESLTLKHDERVIGTADYLAPEQAIDSHSVDSRADIYGLGCTFYYALTGHPPFTEGTLVQRLMAHQSQPVPPVTNERPEVPTSLLRILEKMLAKKREDRYQTGRELADALTQWLFENAPHEWKEVHLPMYAALRLQDLLSGRRKPSMLAESSSEAAGPEKITATAANSRSAISKKSIGDRTLTGTAQVASRKSVTLNPRGANSSVHGESSAAADNVSARAVRKHVTQPQPGLLDLARRHPAVTLVLSVVAAVVVLAVSVYLLRPPSSPNSRVEGQAATSATQTAQSNFTAAK
jgi:serine/threonine-protein kinase